ncbi:MAG: hypothetical protein ACI8ZN_002559 [Bacteroidia bacterium]|jgi:hypothetical protein
MDKRLTYIFLFIFLFTNWGCTSFNLVEAEAGAPIIDLVSITPSTVKEFEDSIEIVISYKDSDGDLGTENPDVNFLTIQDLRLTKADYYYVPLLAPPEARINIEGTLTIHLKNTFLLGTSDSEVTSYQIILTDRANNKSNVLITDQITITR